MHARRDRGPTNGGYRHREPESNNRRSVRSAQTKVRPEPMHSSRSNKDFFTPRSPIIDRHEEDAAGNEGPSQAQAFFTARRAERGGGNIGNIGHATKARARGWLAESATGRGGNEPEMETARDTAQGFETDYMSTVEPDTYRSVAASFEVKTVIAAVNYISTHASPIEGGGGAL